MTSLVRAVRAVNANKLTAAFLALYLFALPIRSSIVVRNLAFWSAVLALVVSRLAARRPLISNYPRKSLTSAISLWVAWCFASTAWSVNPRTTFHECFVDLALPVLVFFVYYEITEHARWLDLWAAAVAVGLAFMDTIAIVQFANEGAWQPQRWHVSAGFFAMHAAIAIPMLAWLAVRFDGFAVRTGLFTVMIGTLLVLYWSENRAIWPVLGLMAVSGVLFRFPRLDIRRRYRLLAVGAAGCALAAIVLMQVQEERDVALSHVSPGASASLTVDPRWVIWQQALDRISENPLLGRGFGRASLAIAPEQMRDHVQIASQWQAHNVFLDVVLETGLIGLAIYLLCAGLIVRILGSGLFAAPPARTAAGVGLVIALAFLLKNSIDDFATRHISLECAALAGALCAVASRR